MTDAGVNEWGVQVKVHEEELCLTVSDFQEGAELYNAVEVFKPHRLSGTDRYILRAIFSDQDQADQFNSALENSAFPDPHFSYPVPIK